MPSLWTACAQTVRSTWLNYVGSFPQLPHRLVGNISSTRLIPTAVRVYHKTLRAKYTQLSTAKILKITDDTGEFYPLSTPPTITTTIYINRRGAAQ